MEKTINIVVNVMTDGTPEITVNPPPAPDTLGEPRVAGWIIEYLDGGHAFTWNKLDARERTWGRPGRVYAALLGPEEPR